MCRRGLPCRKLKTNNLQATNEPRTGEGDESTLARGPAGASIDRPPQNNKHSDTTQKQGEGGGMITERVCMRRQGLASAGRPGKAPVGEPHRHLRHVARSPHPPSAPCRRGTATSRGGRRTACPAAPPGRRSRACTRTSTGGIRSRLQETHVRRIRIVNFSDAHMIRTATKRIHRFEGGKACVLIGRRGHILCVVAKCLFHDLSTPACAVFRGGVVVSKRGRGGGEITICKVSRRSVGAHRAA